MLKLETDKMKVFLITSNIYTHVCPTSIEFLKRYWPEAQVTVLGYENVREYSHHLKDVETVFLGEQDSFGRSWSSALIPYFKTVKDETFVILVEDLILMNRVDHSKIKVLDEKIRSGKAKKAVIGGGIPLDKTSLWEDDLLLFNQNIDYRCTLHPSIWNKEYFEKFLKEGHTIWDFEVANNELAKSDGEKIIALNYRYPETMHLFSSLNLYSRRELTINKEGSILDNQPSSKFFKTEDIQEIWESINEAKK